MIDILLIDDDLELCELLSEYLELEGLSLASVNDGLSGVEQALHGEYRLVLLDVNLPQLNGFEVLKQIRQTSQIPILMLTARGDDIDRIVGLEIGADDYLPKPFNHRELVARIKAILRRTSQVEEPLPTQSILQYEDIVLNLNNRDVQCQGKTLEFTATEFTILKTLIETPGVLIDKERLTQLALGRKLMEYDRAIDMHISNVRKKLGPKPDASQRIKTVRGAGYFYVTE